IGIGARQGGEAAEDRKARHNEHSALVSSLPTATRPIVERQWSGVTWMLSGRILLDQPSRQGNGDRGAAPRSELLVGRLRPALRKRGIALSIELARENKPSLGEIAGNHGAEDAHLAPIESFARLFAPLDAAAPIAALGD